MRYTSNRKAVTGDGGRRLFFVTLFLCSLLAVAFFLVQPPAYGDLSCRGDDPRGCGCPSSPEDIRFRNVLIVDTTDPLRKGKYDDIERLVSSIGTTPMPFFEWLREGKRTDMTSVFILSDIPVADMQPVAKFCTPPPKQAQAIGFKGREIDELVKSMTERARDAVRRVQDASSASQSAIVGALATVVKSSSHWVPGSTLVLASDLIENTPTCGWFEKLQAIPDVSAAPQTCQSLIREFQEGLRPNSVHRRMSVVAVCSLPGKEAKAGLHAFWSGLVKGASGYDVLYSCDPAVIQARRDFLTEKSK